MTFIIRPRSVWTVKWQNVYISGGLAVRRLSLCCFIYSLFTYASAPVSLFVSVRACLICCPRKKNISLYLMLHDLGAVWRKINLEIMLCVNVFHLCWCVPLVLMCSTCVNVFHLCWCVPPLKCHMHLFSFARSTYRSVKLKRFILPVPPSWLASR
jgi:hypothetical protein